MRNVVVDTNVLIRAFLSPDGSAWRIFQLAIDEKITVWYSHELLTEFSRVCTYPRLKKYNVTNEKSVTFIETLVAFGKVVQPKSLTICRDPDDNEILGIALALVGPEPVYLISTDDDLLVLAGSIEGVNILTPQEFLKQKFT